MRAPARLKWTLGSHSAGSVGSGADTWKNGSAQRTGAANAWSVIVADPGRNLVFVPTSSPSPDYFGGERLGDNLFANSVVALRADTGARVWHFQTVHHDLWDYDVASPPILFDLRRERPTIAAVARRLQDRPPLRARSGNRHADHSGGRARRAEERRARRGGLADAALPCRSPLAGRTSLQAGGRLGLTEEDRRWCRETVASCARTVSSRRRRSAER